jgi:hypothetical protein
MSATQSPVVRFRDPRICIEQAPIIAIDQGAESIDSRRSPSNTFSRDSISFNELSTGGTGMVLDRKMFIEYEYSPVLSISGITGSAPNDILYGTNTSSAIILTASAVKFSHTPFAVVAGPPYIPALSTADRCRNSLNNILALVGLGSPLRSVGPRAFGLLQSTKNLGVTINGNTINTNISEYVNALQWYDCYGHECHADYSKCASYPDLFKTYKEATYARTSPLASYGGQLSRETRGSMWYLPQNSVTSIVDSSKLLDASVTGAYYCIDGFAFKVISESAGFYEISEVRFTTDMTETVSSNPSLRFIRLIEPLMLPILNQGEEQSRGLYGVNKFSVDINLMSSRLPQKWFSGDVFNVDGAYAGDIKHNIDVQVQLANSNNVAYLHYNILRPHDVPLLPSVNTYQNKKITVQTKSLGSFSGSKTSQSSGDIQFGTIPSRIYIYVKEKSETAEIQDTDVFCRIDKLQFQFNSAGSQFASCQTEQLYHMSKESGLKMSLPQWRDHCGSVLCIDFSKNVNLAVTEYPGCLGSYRFNYSVDLTQLREAQRIRGSEEMILYTIIVEEGVATLQDQSMQLTVGTLQIDPSSVPIRYRSFDQKWVNMYGGSFVDTLKKVGHVALTGAQKALEYGKIAAPYVKKYGTMALPYIEKGLALALPLLAAGAGVSHEKAIKMVHKHGEEEAMKMLKKLTKARGGDMYGSQNAIGSGVVGGKSKKKVKGGAMTTKSEMSKFLKEF